MKVEMTCTEKREFLHYGDSEDPEHLVAVKFGTNLLRGDVEDAATIIMVKDMADDFEIGEDYEMQISVPLDLPVPR